ncbi:hypothetical protein B0T18DRAFT_431034 [Schizothecium vesticola]|uniref:F-box domain-containing protein n=1 Tax=Schizothecium vesticola TaxID=314040 RepID=A0AA40K2T2_9PEZI|nr:hypothetical protein B0T18DRAFT_431034 [Schizothecium vesticola]
MADNDYDYDYDYLHDSYSNDNEYEDGEDNEILIHIFRAIADGYVWPDPGPVRSYRRCRLTCRRFCDIASAFLIPTLTVSMSPESLARLEAISQHPVISAESCTDWDTTAKKSGLERDQGHIPSSLVLKKCSVVIKARRLSK